MRWQDMTPDKPYALTGRPRLKVTVLDTPAEVRAKARVRVRFETGVAAGRVLDIPSQRVAEPWDSSRVQKPAPQRGRQQAVPVLLLSREARVGDTVTLEETGDLLWTVDAVDDERSTATISTVIFERPDSRTVARDRLQVRGKPSQRVSRRSTERPSSRPSFDAEDAAVERLRPIAPRRELDELMDDVLFTRACLRDYDRRLGAGRRGPAVERLREEVRRSGYLLRGRQLPGNEYARVRIDGRFDIVLARKPTPEEPLTITGLYFPARNKTRRRRQRPGKNHRRAA